jgi:hypothetical protein
MSSVLKSAVASVPSAMLLHDQLEDVLHVEFTTALIHVTLVCAWTKEMVKATNSPAIRVFFIEGDVG